MKIAFVSQPFDAVLPPRQNSIGLWTYEVARRLAREHEVSVYLKGGRFAWRREHHSNVHYHHVPMAPDIALLGLLRRLPASRSAKRPLFASQFNYLGYAWQVARDLRQQRCDVVHLINFSQFVPIVRALNPNATIVLNMRCEWLTQLDHAMIVRRLAKIDSVLGCSDYVTSKIRESFPGFADRCKTSHNAVDTGVFVPGGGSPQKPNESVKRLLFVGRVSPEKGLHVLLHAFRLVVDQFPEVRLDIVGPQGQLPLAYFIALSGDKQMTDLTRYYAADAVHGYVKHLQNQAVALGLTDKVLFHGSRSHAQLLHHYQQADVFVFPSAWNEPFGVPPIEAMATGVPVIASRAGGIAETVDHGKTGLLVEPNDDKALSNAMLCLLRNDRLSTAMGKAGRQRAVEYFSFDRLAERLVDHYFGLCANHESIDTKHFRERWRRQFRLSPASRTAEPRRRIPAARSTKAY